ncbi:MAG: SIS domain-containing protein [Sporichthyaceae bacterium]
MTAVRVAGHAVLDDEAALRAGDPQDMLALVAAAGSQVGQGRRAAAAAGVEALRERVRPRTLVVAGMGGSAASGDVLAALTGEESPLPVFVHRGYGLPGWVGAEDLVIGVSCSGSTAETLSAVEEANRRGVPTLGVGAADSPIARAVLAGGGRHVAVAPAGHSPRGCLWSLATPLLITADILGVGRFPGTVLDAVASALDEVATACAPHVPRSRNPAKDLAARLIGDLPMVWGFTPLSGVAATRFVNQLAENANTPALAGSSSEAQHNQIVALDGPFGRRGARGQTGLHLVLVQDSAADGAAARRVELSLELAAEAGVPASSLRAPTVTGTSPAAELAALIGLGDFASVYLALASGIDPTPVAPITDLKARM